MGSDFPSVRLRFSLNLCSVCHTSSTSMTLSWPSQKALLETVQNHFRHGKLSSMWLAHAWFSGTCRGERAASLGSAPLRVRGSLTSRLPLSQSDLSGRPGCLSLSCRPPSNSRSGSFEASLSWRGTGANSPCAPHAASSSPAISPKKALPVSQCKSCLSKPTPSKGQRWVEVKSELKLVHRQPLAVRLVLHVGMLKPSAPTVLDLSRHLSQKLPHSIPYYYNQTCRSCKAHSHWLQLQKMRIMSWTWCGWQK